MQEQENPLSQGAAQETPPSPQPDQTSNQEKVEEPGAAPKTPSPSREAKDPKIAVIGVGGAGNNAVNNMIHQGDLDGVHFFVCNTDIQVLRQSLCENRIQIGKTVSMGLGAGSSPEMGRAAAEEDIQEVLKQVEDAHMLFVTAGMGGGTGTGAAPVIAKAARERGILTVGVVTKPFDFEGYRRKLLAEEGIQRLEECVDMLLVIPNQNLFSLTTQETTLASSFAMADSVLHQAIQTVTTLILKPGLINLDFADIRFVIQGVKGKSLMGTGEASGENRALKAAENAISCPLLENMPLNQGAVSALINITGGKDISLHEISEATQRIKEELSGDAHIIFGATFDDRLAEGAIRVSVIITGLLKGETASEEEPENKPASLETKEEEESIQEAVGQTHGQSHESFFSKEEEEGFPNSMSFHEDEEENDYLKEETPPEETPKGGFFNFFKRKNKEKSLAAEEKTHQEFKELMKDFSAKKTAKNQTPYGQHNKKNKFEEGEEDPFPSRNSIPSFLRKDKPKK